MDRRFALAALMALAGCGGGGGGSSAPSGTTIATSPAAPAAAPSAAPAAPATPVSAPAPPAPPPLTTCATPRHIAVQLFGDSTMRGYDGAVNTGARAAVYPELALQAAFDAQFGAGQVTVTTRAVDGMTSQNLIDGTDGLNFAWPGSVNADLVVVNFGVNDRFANIPTATYKANLRRLGVGPARVVFQTPLPVWASYYPTQPDTSYAPEMRAVAAELGITVADAGAFALARADWPTTYAPISVHPTSAGYQLLVTSVLAPTLMPIATTLRCT